MPFVSLSFFSFVFCLSCSFFLSLFSSSFFLHLSSFSSLPSSSVFFFLSFILFCYLFSFVFLFFFLFCSLSLSSVCLLVLSSSRRRPHPLLFSDFSLIKRNKPFIYLFIESLFISNTVYSHHLPVRTASHRCSHVHVSILIQCPVSSVQSPCPSATCVRPSLAPGSLTSTLIRLVSLSHFRFHVPAQHFAGGSYLRRVCLALPRAFGGTLASDHLHRNEAQTAKYYFCLYVALRHTLV